MSFPVTGRIKDHLPSSQTPDGFPDGNSPHRSDRFRSDDGLSIRRRGSDRSTGNDGRVGARDCAEEGREALGCHGVRVGAFVGDDTGRKGSNYLDMPECHLVVFVNGR